MDHPVEVVRRWGADVVELVVEEDVAGAEDAEDAVSISSHTGNAYLPHCSLKAVDSIGRSCTTEPCNTVNSPDAP